MDNRQVFQATEAKKMLDFLRALGTEEQRIAYAVLEGMRLQKSLDSQERVREKAGA